MAMKYIKQFEERMAGVLEDTVISTSEVIRYAGLMHDYTLFSDKNAEITIVLKKLAGFIKEKKVGIFPASSFVSEFLSLLADKEVNVYDDFRHGEIIDGKTIRSTADMSESDVIVFLSFRHNLLDILHKRTDRKIISIQSALEDIVRNDLPLDKLFTDEKFCKEKVDKLLNKINESANPVIFVCGFLLNNFGPTFKAIADNGYDVFIAAANRYLMYARQDSDISEFPVENITHFSLPEILYLCEKLDKGLVFLNDMSFITHDLNAYRGLLSMSFTTTLLKTIKTKKILFLYDIVSSFCSGLEYEPSFLRVYRKMLNAADALILSSNTGEGYDSLQGMFNLNKPNISFFRYSGHVNHLQDKLTDGFHLAIIGGMDNKLRDSRRMLIKLIHQGIHIHNYVPCKAMLEFEGQLTEDEKQYYTLHESIVDQNELIYEISKYHAGWIVDDSFEMVNMINSVSTPEIKTIFIMFRLTTISSSLIVHAAAGLPVIVNRTVVHIREKFPEEFFIPFEEPETDNFSNMIQSKDWEKIYSVTQQQRHLFSIDHNISKLIKFMEGIS